MRDLIAISTVLSMIFGGAGNSGQGGKLVAMALSGGPVAVVQQMLSSAVGGNDGSQAIRIVSVPVTGKFSGKFH